VVRARLKLLAILITLPFVAILARLAMLQLPAASVASYRRQSEHRMSRLDPPRRGRILASDGSPLATNRTVCQLHFRYSDLNPIDEALAGLTAVLAKGRAFADAAGIQARMREMVDVPAFIRREVDAGPSEEPRWTRIVESIDEKDAKELARRWKDGAEVFRLRPGRLSGRSDVWFDPALALQMEICLARLERLLRAHEVPFGDLPTRIAKELKGIERRVEDRSKFLRDANTPPRLIQQEATALRRKERSATWILVEEVPLAGGGADRVPARSLPGIACVDSVLREYPGGEVCGLLTGWTQQIARDENLLKWATQSEKFLARSFSSLAKFVRHREVRFGRFDWIGVEGLEETYDSELRGAPGLTTWKTDARSNLRGVIEAVPRRDGDDIRTTIDLPLQRKPLRQRSRQPLRRSKPLAAGGGTAGSVAVMDVASGALLASVGFPGCRRQSGLRARLHPSSSRNSGRTRRTRGGWIGPSTVPLFPRESAFQTDRRRRPPWRQPGPSAALHGRPTLHVPPPFSADPRADVRFELTATLRPRRSISSRRFNIPATSISTTSACSSLGPERIWTWGGRISATAEPSGVDLPRRKGSSGRLAREAREAVAGPWPLCDWTGPGRGDAAAGPSARTPRSRAVCTQVPTPHLVTPQPPKPLQLEKSPYYRSRAGGPLARGARARRHGSR
jgi:cell division protein FtsI/penicillin-binding protein 2